MQEGNNVENFVTLKEMEVQDLCVNLAFVDIEGLRTNSLEACLPFLTGEEKPRFKAFKVEKRRWEWFAGRLGIKLLVCDAHPGTEPNDVDVEPNWTRKPFARILGNYVDACISISHSGDLAVCGLVHGGKLGIDLERVEPHGQGFLEEAFSPLERERLGTNVDWAEVVHQWTRKEAVAKALGIGLGLSLHDIFAVGEAEVALSDSSSWRLCLEPGRRFVTHRVADLGDKWSGDYVLNLCVLEEGDTVLGLVDTPECLTVSGGLVDER